MKRHKVLKTIAIFCLIIALTRSLFPLSPALDIRETIKEVAETTPESFFDDFSTCTFKVKYSFESLVNYIKAPFDGTYEFMDIMHYDFDEAYDYVEDAVDKIRFVDEQGGLAVFSRTTDKTPLEFIGRVSDLLEEVALLVWEVVQDVFAFTIYWFKLSIKFIFGR